MDKDAQGKMSNEIEDTMQSKLNVIKKLESIEERLNVCEQTAERETKYMREKYFELKNMFRMLTRALQGK